MVSNSKQLKAISLSIIFAACVVGFVSTARAADDKVSEMSARESQLKDAGVDPAEFDRLSEKPIFEMTEDEVDAYLRGLSATMPSLTDRVETIGKKNLGQPYEIFLLGEAPFEMYDPQPLYCLEKSDCVVFSEHTYAMALAHDWPSFFELLQRIRYKDGEISVLTRNHYTEVDWNTSNEWLVKDLTEQLAGQDAGTYSMPVDRAKFFRNRYKLDVDIPKEVHNETFIPVEMVPEIKDELRDGDFVNFVRERNGGYWVGHTGLIIREEVEGETYLLHSTPPQVKIEPIETYIENHAKRVEEDPDKARLAGFKFLRLREDPLANLREIDGPEAPVIKPPSMTGIKRIQETAMTKDSEE